MDDDSMNHYYDIGYEAGYSIANKEIESLRQQVTALEAKLAIAIEALEFYIEYDDDGIKAVESLNKIKGE